MARLDAQIFGGVQGVKHAPHGGHEQPVHVLHAQPGIGQGVVGGLGQNFQMVLAGQLAKLGEADADNRGRAAQFMCHNFTPP